MATPRGREEKAASTVAVPVVVVPVVVVPVVVPVVVVSVVVVVVAPGLASAPGGFVPPGWLVVIVAVVAVRDGTGVSLAVPGWADGVGGWGTRVASAEGGGAVMASDRAVVGSGVAGADVG